MTETCPTPSVFAPESDVPVVTYPSEHVLSDISHPTGDRVVSRLALRVVSGPDAGRRFTFALDGAGRPLRGGRSDLCDLVLRDPRVSDVHFELVAQRGALIVRDLDSATGVLSGDLRVREAWLAPGTTFTVGATILELAALDLAELPCFPFCHLGDLDGRSPAMHLLFHRIAAFATAPRRLHGVFAGEAGTGKALAARSLHLLSPDRGCPFVVLDLRRRPRDQVHFELFGTSARRGKLAEAAGGTLLIQAIDELPLATQAALARALATAPVRLLATTRRDLQRLAAAGLFDPDLHARLSDFHLVLPPLRERGRDVVFLAERILARLTADAPAAGFTADALAAMREHAWPGNVRELRFVVERAHLAARSGPIDRTHLALGLNLEPSLARVASLLTVTHDEAVAGFETLYFRHQLASHRTKVAAARAAGMTDEGFRLACRRVRVY
ncbi:MAG TPA: sigma 54-interacting transcriptional regulator [Nannocystis sp.]